MKRVLLVFGLILAVAGCSNDSGSKEEGAAGKPGELGDSTRMDSAALDVAVDSMAVDSMVADSVE